MTDIMKLAEAMAVAMAGDKDALALIEARAALQSAIEALQKEVSTLDVLLEECKMDWSGDVTQLKAEHKHEIDALQSKLDAMGKGEPVAHVYAIERTGRPLVAWDDARGVGLGDKLYAAPKALAPESLTNEQIQKILRRFGWCVDGIGEYTNQKQVTFARVIEAAHGIGGTP